MMRHARRLPAALVVFVLAGCGSDGPGTTPTISPPPAPPAPPPPPEPPGKPTGIRVAEAGRDFILWTWDPVEGATGYEGDAFREEAPDDVTRFQTPGPSYRWEGLAPGDEISILLRAVRATSGGRAHSPWVGPFTASTLLPEPPSPPPTLRAVAEFWSQPSGSDGYYVGERIRVVLNFSPERTTVEGSPRLAIQIGEHVRLADFGPWVEDDFPPERPSLLQRFEYEVAPDDRDADGITLAADAFDFSEGAFLNVAGVQIEVDIHGIRPRHSADPVEPGEALDAHRVVGSLEPRVCTTERRYARRYHDAVLVREWDGTPFRFYWDAGIPESEREDAEHFFGVVKRLAERIEAQLGYPVIEVAGWVEEDERGFRIGRTDVRDCEGVRPEGIVATVIPERTPFDNLVIARARPSCAVLYWTRNDIDTTLDGVMDHELFHLFGFQHSPESTHPFKSPRGVGTPMTVHLTNSGSATPADIDALGCVFPRADFPRD